MKRAAGYLGSVKRKSDANRLKKQMQEWCDANDILISEWLDDGFAGIGEVAYGDWLNGRKVDAVVVSAEAVKGMNVFEFYAYKAVLKRRHSDLVVASDSESFPGYNLYLKIMDELIDTMCRIDVQNKPVKTNNGRIDKAAKGAYIGGRAPMGYQVKDGKLVVNPKEAEVVRFVLDCKHRGKTMVSTMDALNTEGYRTRAGKLFVISTVQSIWNNEMFYKGYYRYKDGDWVKGQHEAIVGE